MNLKNYEYYRTDLGVLYCGDCLEILPLIDKVDLVLTDPQYGIGEADGKNKSRSCIAKSKDYGNEKWDNEIQDGIEPLIEKYKCIVFGGQCYKFTPNYGWIVWDKDNGKNDFSDCELAYTNFLNAVRYYKWKWHGMLQENMKNKDIRVHPTQKPLGLFMQLINNYSKENDLILDCFLGSGTTAVACEKLGRRWIGIEISKKYCAIARQRIKNEADQLKLL